MIAQQPPVQPTTRDLPANKPAAQQAVAAQTTAKVPAQAVPSSAQVVAVDDPSKFELNEATRSKSWPKRDQAMDDYLARHNQMTGSNTGNDLISYAQMLSAPEAEAMGTGEGGQ
jgi:hypothetical protein